MRVIVRGFSVFAGETMDLDERLQDATRRAIDASKAIDRARWPAWADNVAIFTLARYLASVDRADEIDADNLEPYVRSFWSALHDPADWEEARAQFQDIWDHTKAILPVCAEVVRVATERANRAKDRANWSDLPGPKLRRLARICWELAQMHTDGMFFLSQHTAAAILGIDQRTAGRMFHQLCRESVIIESDRPPKGCQKAIRYRFL